MTLRDWLLQGPFTLAMSSGFFGFFAHAGLLSVLEDEEALLPSRVCGSSAGALVAGLWAAGVSARTIRQELLALRRDHFWDPRPGLGLLRGALFRARLDTLLAGKTFDQCRVPLAISVFDVWAGRTTVLRAGEVAAAVHASCAAPVLFQPVRVAGRLYLDGGILDRPGLQGAEHDDRVLFHHLTARSPWRRPGSPAPRTRGAGMQVVAIDGIPRVNPFRLDRGPAAMDSAQRGTRTALDSTLA